jgi:hypothetical protein
MATTFKTFLNNDIAATRTMLHEAIPVTGSLVSGTYGGNAVALGSEPHVKSYSHGMFQSVYDYPYLSSSANHIFDIAVGISPKGGLYAQTTSQQSKKANIYNQMAQVLMGHDVTGSIQEFDADGNILAGGTKLQEVFFLNFARLLAKDEVKKGSFELELGTACAHSQALNKEFTKRIKLTDASGSNGFFVNSPAGEYGILYAQTTADGDDTLSSNTLYNETLGTTSTHPACGLIFYQAGIAVISGSVFNAAAGTVKHGIQKVGAAAAATVVFGGVPTVGNAMTLISSDGTTVVYTCHGSTTGGSGAAVTFDDGSANNGAAGFVAAVALGDHADKITAVNDAGTVTLTQKVTGEGGATVITSNLANVAINGGGAGAGGVFNASVGTGGSAILAAGADQAGFNFVTASTIDTTCNAIRNRIYNMQFNNTTELNSSIYFCRINHNDFNYSSNPTYLSGSKIRVKDSTVDNPVTYLTTVGLYSADNELLAVAKLSEPLKKDPSTEMTLRVRLDY